ncbi:methyltransferase domain-containing protein [Sorangium sp. So ce1024]|uniref:class I SAM-dependent methyltransferase n=1 Tax=Sorangium sp. So ce1024 TaxID=3133327 RepID=UPI003EFCAAAC
MPSQYDEIGDAYTRAADQLLFRRVVERHTLLEVLGPVEGLSVLDVACGDGYYTRLFRQAGAARVVGVDVSEQMIKAARARDEGQEPGIEYRVHDAAAMPVLGSFDRITAVYLLNYAGTREQMVRMGEGMFANLAPGGRLVAVLPNDGFDPAGPSPVKYGVAVRPPEDRKDGSAMGVELLIGPSVAIDFFYWSRSAYEQALAAAGFQDVCWHPLECAPEPEPDAAFWSDYLANPHAIAMSCRRPLG